MAVAGSVAGFLLSSRVGRGNVLRSCLCGGAGAACFARMRGRACEVLGEHSALLPGFAVVAWPNALIYNASS